MYEVISNLILYVNKDYSYIKKILVKKKNLAAMENILNAIRISAMQYFRLFRRDYDIDFTKYVCYADIFTIISLEIIHSLF